MINPIIPNIKPAIPIPLPEPFAIPTIPRIIAIMATMMLIIGKIIANTPNPNTDNIAPANKNMKPKGIEIIPNIKEAIPRPFPIYISLLF